MAKTSIADLWTPDVWIDGLNEKVNTMPSLINSGIAVRTAQFDDIADGEGITANVPYFRDITDQADAPQVEDTQPTLQKMGSGKQIAPIMNRESGLSNTALSAAVSGSNPGEGIVTQLALRRLKQRQTTLLSLTRGAFGFATAPGGAGALTLNRNDVFLEAGANPAANQCVSAFNIIDTIARLGELADTTTGGSILMHPLIRGSLLKQDQISFEHLSQQDGTKLEYYKGYRVFVSNLLFRVGAVSGYVFDTYIFGPAVFAWGEKPQVDGNQIVAVAALSYFMDTQKNNQEMYDRSRFVLHLNGMRWIGVPALQSASNAELANAANWSLDYTTPDRTGVVCIRSNG